jgi:hypothetical protein
MNIPQRSVIVLLSGLLLACTPATQHNGALLNRMKDRGIVALSEDNPYLVANTFLANEAARSPELHGFLETRGAPWAMKVEKEMFDLPRLTFFYPPQEEHYLLEEEEGSWIIEGPFRTDDDELRDLKIATERMTHSPKLAGVELPRAHATPVAPTPTPTLPVIERPVSVPATATPTVAPDAPEVQQLSPAEARYQSVITKLEATIESNAELTPKGDVVHYVTFPGETLSMIARWYTHDRENVGRIARINAQKNPDVLAVGDTVIVPSYLLKNRKRFTEKVFSELQEVMRAR